MNIETFNRNLKRTNKKAVILLNKKWVPLAGMVMLLMLAFALPLLLVVQSVQLMGISDDSVSEQWKLYISLSLLLGMCFLSVVVATWKHRTKKLYNSKRYLLLVIVFMAAATSLVAGAISSETARVSSLNAVKQSSSPSVEQNSPILLQQESDQMSAPVDNSAHDTQSTPNASNSALTSNTIADCEVFEKSARIGSTQFDADSLHGSYLSDKALYDGWDVVYTKDQQQQKISASYQKYTTAVDIAYQRYRDEFNSNLYCFPQMPKPVIREP